MLGRSKKELIYYSQYLDLQSMQMNSSTDMLKRSEKESKFFQAVRGVDDSCIEKLVPKVVKFLANEMNLLGEYFIC